MITADNDLFFLSLCVLAAHLPVVHKSVEYISFKKQHYKAVRVHIYLSGHLEILLPHPECFMKTYQHQLIVDETELAECR